MALATLTTLTDPGAACHLPTKTSTMTALERFRRKQQKATPFRNKTAAKRRSTAAVPTQTVAASCVPTTLSLTTTSATTTDHLPPPLEIDIYTSRIMKCEFLYYVGKEERKYTATLGRGVPRNAATLGQVLTALRASRKVLDCPAIADLSAATNIFDRKQCIYERRYQLMGVWERLLRALSQNAAVWYGGVSSWGEVAAACRGYLKFPDESLASSIQSQGPSILQEYLDRLRHEDDQEVVESGLAPSLKLWQELAAHQSSSCVEKDSLDKADRLWNEAFDKVTKLRQERLVGAELRQSAGRLQAYEAAAKASSLLRELTDSEKAMVRQALSGPATDDVLAQFDSDLVTRKNMQTLRPRCVSVSRKWGARKDMLI